MVSSISTGCGGAGQGLGFTGLGSGQGEAIPNKGATGRGPAGVAQQCPVPFAKRLALRMGQGGLISLGGGESIPDICVFLLNFDCMILI